MNKKELIKMAAEARKNAYTPYSGYAVGAALLAKSEKIYLGCNVESASFSPTCCAERSAFFSAVSAGERAFSAIAIVGGRADSEKFEICSPCGVCRQVMSEFCTDDFSVILADSDGREEILTLAELLPKRFTL